MAEMASDGGVPTGKWSGKYQSYVRRGGILDLERTRGHNLQRGGDMNDLALQNTSDSPMDCCWSTEKGD